MAKHDEYFVEPRSDGRWNVKKPHAEKASAITETQQQAIAKARKFAPEGDIKVKGLNGKFRHV
ncbi:MAG: DUF2188 domain-containing protein [Nevskia sp.]|nr:DUF2188 domain-containing protein [Nevskia sp.]